MPRSPRPLKERFWSKVIKSDGCWAWTGTFSSKGYGVIWDEHKTQKGAHVVSFMMNVGPIPKGMFVYHKCDNPPCVNPEHLFLGTPSDSMKDMQAKGRDKKAFGETHVCCKISDDQALTLIAEYGRGGTTFAKLALKYGISYAQAYRLYNNQTRTYLSSKAVV